MKRLSSQLVRHCAAVLTLALMTGCGQTLTVRVERLGAVEPKDLPKGVLQQLQREPVSDSTAGNFAEATQKLAEAVPDPSIKERLSSETANFMAAQKSRDPANLERSFNAIQEAVKAAASQPALAGSENATALKEQQLAGDEVRRSIDGYQSSTVYVLADGSKAFELLGHATSRPTLVREPIRVELAGDTSVVAVQQTPTLYNIRSIDADPRELIRNTLIIANRILRVAAMYVPLLAPVADAVPTGDPSAKKPLTQAEATADTDALDQSARAVLDDSRLKEIEATINLDPKVTLNPDDQRYLIAKMSELNGALGVKPRKPAGK